MAGLEGLAWACRLVLGFAKRFGDVAGADLTGGGDELLYAGFGGSGCGLRFH